MSRLELTWVGKERQSPVEPRILVEDTQKSYISDRKSEATDDNVLIRGDNLLALRALESRYSGEVKCIFIDPPYNTGSIFEHYDDGVEHSLWLTFMRDRLEVLRRLLAINGSLWITIDDNEGHYLKVLCDEVFGRQNFISTIVWQKKYTSANDARFFSDTHDFILVYAKDAAQFRLNRLPREERQNAAYRNPDNDPRGPWKATPLHAKSGRAGGFAFTFQNGVVWSPPPGTFPRYSVETMRQLDRGGEIWFGRDGRATPSRKTFLSAVNSGVVPKTVWLHDEVGHNHEARTEAKQLVPLDPFATPKPERLLERVLQLATDPGDLVLDSFAGSGTTGAVAHKMGRRWIMVEVLPSCDTHILPRLRQVIDGTDRGGITTSVDWSGGGGFRYCRLAPSLLEKDRYGNWIVSKQYDAAMLAEAMCKHEGFTYAPSDVVYWQQGRSTERDFLYVTTQTLGREQVAQLSEEVGPDRSLLVCCAAFRVNPDGFPNLTLKKIPHAVLHRCEWGRDDYSLAVSQLAEAPAPDTSDDMSAAATRAAAKKRGRKVASGEPELFEEVES